MQTTETCPNCGGVLAEPAKFCSNCGQKNWKEPLSFRRLWGDLAKLIFYWDGKLWSSLKMLVRPGRLTEAYLNEKHAPYFNPIQLFLIAGAIWAGVSSGASHVRAEQKMRQEYNFAALVERSTLQKVFENARQIEQHSPDSLRTAHYNQLLRVSKRQMFRKHTERDSLWVAFTAESGGIHQAEYLLFKNSPYPEHQRFADALPRADGWLNNLLSSDFTEDSLKAAQIWQKRRAEDSITGPMTTFLHKDSFSVQIKGQYLQIAADDVREMPLNAVLDYYRIQGWSNRLLAQFQLRSQWEFSNLIDGGFGKLFWGVFLAIFPVAYLMRWFFRGHRFIHHFVFLLHCWTFFMLFSFCFQWLPPSFKFISDALDLVYVGYFGLALHYIYRNTWWVTALKTISLGALMLVFFGAFEFVYIVISIFWASI